MQKKLFTALLTFCLFAGFATTVLAQRQSGCIKGKITDSEGFSLPGAFIYLTSPDMLGMQTYITSDTGKLKFAFLPPGQYKITVEMPGFKTVNIEDILVRVGMTMTINITMEATTLEEEITLKPSSPTLDAKSTKITVVIDKNFLTNIPFNRDLHDVLSSVSGLIPETRFPPSSTIFGSTARANTYALDGMNLSNPSGMNLLTNINYDIIKEVELEAAAHPAEVGQIDGGYINVVTKSGGNKFNGGIIISHSNKSLGNTLRSKEEISAMEVSPPATYNHLWDISLSFGGSFLEDKLWYFSNLRMISQSQTSSFIPWTDFQGEKHKEFDWDNKDKMAFFKLTGQFSSQIKVSGMFNFVDRYQSVNGSSLDWNITKDATRSLDHEKNYMGNGVFSYTLDQNTFIDLKACLISQKAPLLLSEEGRENFQYHNDGTGHQWGSASLNEIHKQSRFQAGAYITRFQDSLLWGDHEFKAGAEYEYISGELITWKHDNLLINYFNGNPYYFGLSESPATENTVGKGKISFLTASKEENDLGPKNELNRLSLYIQDSATSLGKLTLNFGIRFDRYTADQLAYPKTESGNPVSNKIGEELIEPVGELNPYTGVNAPEWRNLIIWNEWSPRFGLSFDIFGDGKSIFKVSFSRYTEYLMLQYLSQLNPLHPYQSHQFHWYDENMDGLVDIDDTFTSFPEDYRFYIEEYYKKRIDPDLKSPHTDEFTIGLHQEVFQDLSVRINYIYKNKKNILENVLYDPDLNKDWYTINKDTERWWTPFHTVVPGVDDYPDTPVTVYFCSKDAPPFFDRVKNVSELNRKYQAFEFAFEKRMSNNWQLSGSIVLSKATGNIGLGYGASSGFSSAADGPNYFVNLTEDTRLDSDRPLVMKLMGTYKLPYDFIMSFFYTHMSGTPWARSVTVIPPSSWTQDNNTFDNYVTVLLDRPGTRRNKAIDNLDIRIEKEFKVGDSGRLSAFVDIENALGNKYRFISQNDDGFWFPESENSSQGLRVTSPIYKKITSLSGARILRLSLQLSF